MTTAPPPPDLDLRLGPATTEPPTRARRRLTLVLVTAGTAVGLALIALLALAAPGPAPAGPLDPDSAGYSGTRALAEVLRGQGVQVEVVRTIDAFEDVRVDAGTTVLVGDTAYLGPGAGERAAAHAALARRLVVAAPDDLALENLGVPVEVAGTSSSEPLSASCTSDVADPGDTLVAPAWLYAPARRGTGAATCFVPSGEAPARDGVPAGAVVVLPDLGNAPETVVLGSAAALTNGHVTDGTHAALALRTLGPAERLVWYLPSVTDLSAPGFFGQQRESPDDGVPDWFAPGVLLAAFAVVAYAFARGRRLGPLVTEPLPVVVRAAETTEARGRLYHHASDRGHAAASLRAGTRRRLAVRLGLPPGADSAAVREALVRTTGLPRDHVEPALDGPDPETDHDLLLLAQQLADLEESVRTA